MGHLNKGRWNKYGIGFMNMKLFQNLNRVLPQVQVHISMHSDSCSKQLIKPSAPNYLEVFSGWRLRAAWLSSLNRIRHNGTSLQGEGQMPWLLGFWGHGWIEGRGACFVSLLEAALQTRVETCNKRLQLSHLVCICQDSGRIRKP